MKIYPSKRNRFLKKYFLIFHRMFTLSDISTAHAQVKSGADFPAYARALIAI
jgi:hypothetical protein